MLEGTKRLRFDRLSDAYKADLIEFFSHPEATKFFNPIENPEEFTDAWIEKSQWRHDNHGYSFSALIDKETNEFVGQCGILIQTLDGEDNTHYEVGYHLMPRHWKKGYATEAAQFFRNHVFKEGLADEVISIIHVDNEPSKRVARRNGMKVARKATFRGWPVEIFSITKEEWEKLP